MGVFEVPRGQGGCAEVWDASGWRDVYVVGNKSVELR